MGEELAARYLGIGHTTLRARGPRPVKIGTRTLWDRRDLDRWVDWLTGQPMPEPRDPTIDKRAVERRYLDRLNERNV